MNIQKKFTSEKLFSRFKTWNPISVGHQPYQQRHDGVIYLQDKPALFIFFKSTPTPLSPPSLFLLRALICIHILARARINRPSRSPLSTNRGEPARTSYIVKTPTSRGAPRALDPYFTIWLQQQPPLRAFLFPSLKALSLSLP